MQNQLRENRKSSQFKYPAGNGVSLAEKEGLGEERIGFSNRAKQEATLLFGHNVTVQEEG